MLPKKTALLLLSLLLLPLLAACVTPSTPPVIVADSPRMYPMPADLRATPPSPSSYSETLQAKQNEWAKRLDDWRSKSQGSSSTAKPASN